MKSILRLALIFSYAGIVGSFAAATTWNSTSSSDFTVGNNWSGLAEPGSADVATFGTVGTQTAVSLGSSDSISALTFNAGALSYTLSGAGVLTMTKFNDAAANTEYLNGSYVITNNGAQLVLTGSGGEVVFGVGSSLSFTYNTSGQTVGSAAIDGSLLLGASLNWAGTGTLYYDPTSVTNQSGGALNNTSQNLSSFSTGIVDLQTSVSGYKSVVIGSGSNANGTIYLDASGVSISTPVTMNAGNASVVSGGLYILGMNAAGSATGSVSGTITLQNVGTNTSTDEFDVQNSNTLTVSGQITSTTSTGGVGSNSSVKKIGTGTLILSNTGTASNYAGSTTVSAGTLGVTATTAIPTTTALSVASGANFAVGNAAGGSYIGPVGPTVASLSLTSAGTGVGNEAELSFNIGGTSYDSFTSSGAFTLTGSTFELNVTVAPGSTGTDTLLTWLNAGSTNLSLSNVDLVVNGTDVGTANSSYLTLNSGTNDSLAFNAAAAPEPRAWALMLGGVGLLVFVTRRRAVRSDI